MRVSLLVLSATLFAATLGLACGDDGPTAPSPTPTPGEPRAPDLSALVGVWNVMVRVTEASGSGCVADTMRSQIGVPKPYSLSVTQKDNVVTATLRSASGDYACTFTPVADGSGFTTYGKGGYYTCEQAFVPVSCADGSVHGIFSFGEDISGQLSGTELSGAWGASWLEQLSPYGPAVDMKAEYTGSRSPGSGGS